MYILLNNHQGKPSEHWSPNIVTHFFFLAVRTFKTYSLSIFQRCKRVLLTIVTKPQVTLPSHYFSLFTYRCRVAKGWANLIPQYTAHFHSWKGVGWPLKNTSLFSLHLQFHSCSPFPIVFPTWMCSINLNKCAWMCMKHDVYWMCMSLMDPFLWFFRALPTSLYPTQLPRRGTPLHTLCFLVPLGSRTGDGMAGWRDSTCWLVVRAAILHFHEALHIYTPRYTVSSHLPHPHQHLLLSTSWFLFLYIVLMGTEIAHHYFLL